jgi:hypothetical protein
MLAGPPLINSLKKACSLHGHALGERSSPDVENCYTDPTGRRHCRRCHCLAMRAARARLRGAAVVAA